MNTSRTMDVFKVKYIRKLINDKDYYLNRIDAMEERVHEWKYYYNKAKTNIERLYCSKMMRMYLRRLIYYINK